MKKLDILKKKKKKGIYTETSHYSQKLTQNKQQI